jgi:hypothetical protein
MTSPQPLAPLPPRRINWWGLASLAVLATYVLVCVAVAALWATVGFASPNLMGPATPPLASMIPLLVVGTVGCGSVLAAMAGVVLAIVGVSMPGLPRPLAIVALVISCIALVPTAYLAIAGGFLLVITIA